MIGSVVWGLHEAAHRGRVEQDCHLGSREQDRGPGPHDAKTPTGSHLSKCPPPANSGSLGTNLQHTGLGGPWSRPVALWPALRRHRPSCRAGLTARAPALGATGRGHLPGASSGPLQAGARPVASWAPAAQGRALYHPHGRDQASERVATWSRRAAARVAWSRPSRTPSWGHPPADGASGPPTAWPQHALGTP